MRKGVYLFENFRYLETTRAEPKRYLSGENKPVFGIKRDPACSTTLSLTGDKGFQEPMLIGFKMPEYDLQLHRIEKIEAIIPQQRPVQPAETTAGASPAMQVVKDSVWVMADRIETLLTPVDEPGHQLYIVRPMKPLAPGVYAVHWGAMEGHTSTDPEVYLFQVIDPNAASPQTPKAETEGENKPAMDKSTGEKTAGEKKPKEEKKKSGGGKAKGGRQ